MTQFANVERYGQYYCCITRIYKEFEDAGVIHPFGTINRSLRGVVLLGGERKSRWIRSSLRVFMDIPRYSCDVVGPDRFCLK